MSYVRDLMSTLFEEMRLYHPPGRGLGDLADFEPEFTKYLCSVLREDMLFLDVGAHYGYYVLLASPRVRKVVAVEPSAPVRAVLMENINRNRLGNVTVIETPLFSEFVRGSVRKSAFRPRLDGQLKAATLDSLQLIPDVIKIDIEGAEYDVLKGAKETLILHRPAILFELHPHKMTRFGCVPQDIVGFLQKLGYVTDVLGTRRSCVFMRAEP